MFNLKEELNEHFFEVHPKVVDVYRTFSFDVMVYADLEKIKKKYYRDAKRKRKMKNKMIIIKEQLIPLENGRQKLLKRLKKYMMIYRKALNRYGVPEKKAELLKLADFYIGNYDKLINKGEQK